MPLPRILIAEGHHSNGNTAPFAGATGMLLYRALDAAGIQRVTCKVLSVFPAPPQRSWRGFFATVDQVRSGDAEAAQAVYRHQRDVLRAEYREHIVAFWREVHTFRPTRVLLCGGLALWAASGRVATAAAYGRWTRAEFGPASTHSYAAFLALHPEDSRRLPGGVAAFAAQVGVFARGPQLHGTGDACGPADGPVRSDAC